MFIRLTSALSGFDGNPRLGSIDGDEGTSSWDKNDSKRESCSGVRDDKLFRVD